MMEYLFLLKSMLDTLSVSKTSLLFTKSNTKIVFLVIMHFYNLDKDNYWWWRASCSKNKYSWSRAFCILSFANPLKYNSVLKVLEIQDNLFEQTLWLTYSQRKLMHEYPIKPTSTYFLMEK